MEGGTFVWKLYFLKYWKLLHYIFPSQLDIFSYSFFSGPCHTDRACDENGINYYGSEYNLVELKRKSLEECSCACQKNRDCNEWTWVESKYSILQYKSIVKSFFLNPFTFNWSLIVLFTLCRQTPEVDKWKLKLLVFYIY